MENLKARDGFRTALQSSKLRNTLILLYILAVLGFSASARAEMESFPLIHDSATASSSLKTLKGAVVVGHDGRVFLAVSLNAVFELRNLPMDPADMKGQTIEVRGYELIHKLEPELKTQALGPLPSESSDADLPAPVFVVLQMIPLAF